MFVPSVFVEFKRLAYIVISLVENCIFSVYSCSLCRCILCLTRRHCHFRLCIWAEGWYRQQSKRKGSRIKHAGRSFPTKPQTHPTVGVDQAKCVGPRQDKRALFLASCAHSGWDGHQWHRVKGHVADYSRRNGRAQEVLNTVKPLPTSLTPTELWGKTSKRATLLKDYNWVELKKICWLSWNLTQWRNTDNGRIIWDVWIHIFKQRMQIVFMNL